MKITRQRIRQAQRNDAEGAATALRKITLIQERQIAELVAERDALQAVVIGAAGLAFDYVDPVTGEVEKRPLLRGCDV